MQARQFRPIILKSLADSKGKFPTLDALADFLVSKMEMFEEMASLLILPDSPSRPTTESAFLLATPTPEPSRSVLLPSDSAKTDISERIVPGGRGNGAGMVEHFTKAEIYSYLMERLPASFEIQPAGFAAPLTLYKRIAQAPGDMTFVKVQYHQMAPDNSLVEPPVVETQVSSTMEVIDDVAILDGLKKTAMAVCSPEQRKVPPRMTIPPPQSLSPDPGFSTETDRETPEGDFVEWRKNARPIKFG